LSRSIVLAMKVVVLTTSYPRDPGDPAGRFVADAVRGVEDRGIDVEVVSPATFRHFGLAYGGGILQNVKRQPWRLLLVPGFMAAYAHAARRAAADADVVHAHWLPSALAARATGKPYVVQVWGTDVELARRAPRLARPLLRHAAAVIAASRSLADAATELGARTVDVVPAGVEVPAEVAEPDDPPHALFVGRLSEEKGILEFLEATDGLPRVIVGDGPLRARVPGAVGFVPPRELGQWYERAAVVCVPSRREGYGMTAREAMAYGRAVVASDTGGLRDAITDGETGLLVPPRDPDALRAAVQRLLGDAELRARLGTAARTAAREEFAQDVEAEKLIRLWNRVIERGGTEPGSGSEPGS
jgi:glycosyltransferase involved in cell wall biosynthesis